MRESEFLLHNNEFGRISERYHSHSNTIMCQAHRHVEAKSTAEALPPANSPLKVGNRIPVGNQTGIIRGWISTRAGRILQVFVPR